MLLTGHPIMADPTYRLTRHAGFTRWTPFQHNGRWWQNTAVKIQHHVSRIYGSQKNESLQRISMIQWAPFFMLSYIYLRAPASSKQSSSINYRIKAMHSINSAAPFQAVFMRVDFPLDWTPQRTPLYFNRELMKPDVQSSSIFTDKITPNFISKVDC